MTMPDDKYAIIMQKRSGKTDDPFISISETITVNNLGLVVLEEVPDKFNHVTIPNMYEITEGIPDDTEFLVNYNNGNVTFSTNNNGKQFVATYLGTGKIYVSAKRIATQIGDTGDVIQDLQALTDAANSASTNASSEADYAKQQGDSVKTIIDQFVYKGAYDSTVLYLPYNIVSFDGGTYRCTQNTTGHDPTNITYWSIEAQAGNIRPFQQSWTATDGQTVFITTNPYNPNNNTLNLYVGGIYQPYSSYTQTNANTITLSEGVSVPSGNNVNVTATWFMNNIDSTADITTVSGYGKNIGDTSGLVASGNTIVSQINNHTAQLADISQDVKMFGAKGDGTTDDTQSIKNAIASLPSIGGTLYFPSSNGYIVSDTITIPANINVIMNAPIIYNVVANDRPALVIGSISTESKRTKLKLNVVNNSQSNWKNMNCIGIQLINVNNSDINIVQSYQFTIGLQLRATMAFGWNKFRINMIGNNLKGIHFLCTDEYSTSQTAGWINANNFDSGYISVGSNPSGYVGTPIGIHFDNAKTNVYYNNTNTFNAIDFEGDMNIIQLDYGFYNLFYNLRSETTVGLVTINNNSTGNRFINCFNGNMNNLTISDNSTDKTNFVNYTDLLVYDSGMIGALVSPYGYASFGNTNTYQIKDFSIHSYSDTGNGQLYSNYHYTNDNISVQTSSTSWCIGKFFKLNNTRKIRIAPSFALGNESKIFVTCYDSSNIVITDTTAFTCHNWSFNSSMNAFISPSPITTGENYITFSNTVDHIRISIFTVTGNILYGFKVFANDNATIEPYLPISNDQYLAYDQPTTHYPNTNYIYNNHVTSLSDSTGSYIIKGYFWDGTKWNVDKLRTTSVNYGTASIASSGTSIVVNHGLTTAPTNIVVTPEGNVGNVWISSITSTQFTINCSTAPASATTVSWQAKV